MNLIRQMNKIQKNSLKWSKEINNIKVDDYTCMGLADMDFQPPHFLKDSLINFLEESFLGYYNKPYSLFKSIRDWNIREHNNDIHIENILLFSSVLSGMTTCVEAFSNVGDQIIISQPVYSHFEEIIKDTEREVIIHKLIEKDRSFYFDLEAFEELLKSNDIKIYILCNPHNPSGKVWSKEELKGLIELCEKYNVLIISDEIHQDIIHNDLTFYPISTLASNKLKYISLTSATKTFNIASLKISYAYSSDKEVVERLRNKSKQMFQGVINTFGIIGTETCYNEGKEWLCEVQNEIYTNYKYMVREIEKISDEIKVFKLDSSYLVWIDFNNFINERDIHSILLENNIYTNNGSEFGKNYKGYIRVNIACSKQNIDKFIRTLQNINRY